MSTVIIGRKIPLE